VCLVERRVVTCPTCGFSSRIDPARRYVCRCGEEVKADSTAADIDQEIIDRRSAICTECGEHGDDRCNLIELGCRNAYKRALRAQTPRCPLRKWSWATRIHRFFVQPSVCKLNLLYHVYPLKRNDVWRANVKQLAKRLRIFSGRKLVAVAVGDKCYGMDVVRKAFDDPTIEFLEIPNDPALREVATFLPLLEAIASTEPDEASFYAHTKGNSTKDNALGAEMWRNAMYHHLLDGVNICRDLLLIHPCVGTTKMQWPDGYEPYPTRLKHGNWMFAGTFFWFRHKDVFGHPNWRDVPQDRYGAEAWLSGLFAADQAASVFQPWPANEYPTPSPYDPALYLWPIRDT
jgi:hypothetical protein